MVIENDKVISLEYQLHVDDENGNVVETVKEDKPFVFMFGKGNLLPKFEENLDGLKKGDNFEFKLTSEEGYGEAREDAVVDIPKNVFEVEGKFDDKLIAEGNVVPMQDKDGNRFNGIVVKVADEAVKMDFNHPLAGDNLFFKGKVLEIRDANENEKETGKAEN
ncbi:MAG: FKBP-type peptidyl-prolyl cis-trans isomerase [Bacteroidales bacterium]|jgi:FKBP-type peptidyl-prolyl cis-trans isomerase SlyD|nr:FKBP-type peptidyl-prolyl cis-trans isomerase [Bacteroidales bacterium]